MGNDLSDASSAQCVHAVAPWLDAQTAMLVDDIVDTLAQTFPDLLAVILYGSVARHDERPIGDQYPSDVDLLLVFDTDDEHISVNRGHEVTVTLGEAKCRHLDALRDVNDMLASRTLREWDPNFVTNVARDGILLFARGPLLEALIGMAGWG